MAKRQPNSKRAQVEKLRKLGYSYKEINRIKNTDGQKFQKDVQFVQHHEAQAKKKGTKVNYNRVRGYYKAKQTRNQKTYERTQKLFAFEKVTGRSLDDLPKGLLKRFDKITLKDIEMGNFSIADFPEHYGSKEIDFLKEHKIPNGKKLHFGFRALNGETDIGEELERFSKYSNTELIKSLEQIIRKPLTGSRNVKGKKGRNVGSSGKAGEYEMELKSQETLIDVYARQYNEDRRAKSFTKKINKKAQEKGIGLQHSPIDYHWQYIQQKDTNGKGKSYTSISIRKLLIIGNAILYNIKEELRKDFYKNFYSICCEIIPEMSKILP